MLQLAGEEAGIMRAVGVLLQAVPGCRGHVF
jgi:hypothetical protein